VTDLLHKADAVGASDNFESSKTQRKVERSGDFLTAEETSQYLWDQYRIQRSERRLGQLRALSGLGPPFHRDGNAVRYHRGALDEWAIKQLGEPAISTAQETARRQVQA
jgi:hypothetical protein